MLLGSHCLHALRPVGLHISKNIAPWSLRLVSGSAVAVAHCLDFNVIRPRCGPPPEGRQTYLSSDTPHSTALQTAATNGGDNPPTTALRRSYFESSVKALIKRGSIDEALATYRSELQDGLLPSISLTSHLLRASAKSMSPQTRQEVTNTVIGAIENHKVSWDQGLLATFLSNLADARQYDALEEVVDTYQKIIVIEHKTKIGAKWEKWRPSGIICSIMIKAYCQADRMQDALRWLKRYRHDWKDVTKRGLHPRPYITLIYGLAQRFKPFTDPRPAYTVVRQMIEDEVPMHIMVFNILMALETRRNNLRRVFALYRVLERRHPSLQADATTYATLFTAHKAWLRTRIPKKTPRPRPREIFRAMLHLHHNHTHGRPSYPSPYLTASTLNTIVSCFLLSKDYAAAIVALRTFAVCMLVTTTRTEWIVASTILRRIHGQLAKDNDAEYGQWVDRMRGRVMSAREKMEERKEMKELLISLKGLSHRVAKVLPPDELAAAHLALDSLIGHHGLGRRGALLENPRLTKLQMRSEAQVQLGRPMKLIQQAIFAAFPMGLSQADARDRFNGIMASVNSELLPPRLNRPGKRVGHPADNLRRLEKHRFARKL